MFLGTRKADIEPIGVFNGPVMIALSELILPTHPRYSRGWNLDCDQKSEQGGETNVFSGRKRLTVTPQIH